MMCEGFNTTMRLLQALLMVALCNLASAATSHPDNMKASMMYCDGSGMQVAIINIDESVYCGAPYNQGWCADINCGQFGDSWVRTGSGSNVTWMFTFSMDMMSSYDGCMTVHRNSTEFYYSAHLVIPLMEEPVELSGDWMVEVRCHLNDMVTMQPEVNTISHVEEMIQIVSTIDGRADGPSVVASIVEKHTDEVPISAIELGDRLCLKVDFTDNRETWDQIRVMTFDAHKPDNSKHFHIIEHGCPTHSGLMVNVNETDFTPASYVCFDAFRFKEEARVTFKVMVRSCKGTSSEACNFRCSNLRRGKRDVAPVLDTTVISDTTYSNNFVQMEEIKMIARIVVPDQESSDVYSSDYEDYSMDNFADSIGKSYEEDRDAFKLPIVSKTELSLEEIELTSTRGQRKTVAICLNVPQFTFVSVLLLVVLLLVAIVTGLYAYKLFSRRFHRRHDNTNYGRLAIVPGKAMLVRRQCNCKQALLGGKCSCRCITDNSIPECFSPQRS